MKTSYIPKLSSLREASLPLLVALAVALLPSCKSSSSTTTSSKDPSSPKVRTVRVGRDGEADLGKIMEKDGPLTVRLVLRNEFDTDLHPHQLYTPCGCTKARFERGSVAPGEDQVLEVTYNPAYRPGPMREKIQVQYTDSPIPLKDIYIKGTVIGFNHPIEEDRPYAYGEGLYMSHKILHYGMKKAGEKGDIFFRYGNGDTKKSHRLLFDVPEQYRPFVRLRQPGKVGPDYRDTLHLTFTMPPGQDTVRFFIQPTVDGRPTQERLQVMCIERPSK